MGGSRPRSRPPRDAVAAGAPRSPARSVRRRWCSLPRYAWHSSALSGYVGWVFWTRRGPFALRAHRAPPRGGAFPPSYLRASPLRGSLPSWCFYRGLRPRPVCPSSRFALLALSVRRAYRAPRSGYGRAVAAHRRIFYNKLLVFFIVARPTACHAYGLANAELTLRK